MDDRAKPEEILSVDVPFGLLQGQVRNENEARELAALDVAALREAGALQHTLSFCAYDAGLRAAADALREAGPDPELNAAAVLVDTARAAVKRNLAVLSTEVEGASRQLRASRVALQRFAETNRSLHEELAEEGVGALASSKQKLWLVEESLAHRIASREPPPPPPPAG